MGVFAVKRAAVALAAIACALAPRVAGAAGPLGPNGTRIRTSDYAIDLTGGPLLLGTRALGLGGAYVAIAEGIDGNLQNPASPAVRATWSEDHVDWDLGVGLLFPSTFSGSDFYNTGRGRTDLRRSDPSEFALLAPAGNLQVGAWGVGLALDLQRFGLERRIDPTGTGQEELVRAQFSVLRTYLARAVDDGQVVGGLGFHVTALDVTTKDEIFTRQGNVFTTRGVNLEGGLLWRPNYEPFRVGFALRAPVLSEVDSKGRSVAGDIVIGDPAARGAIFLPRRVKRPWSADAGVALQLGPRPLNPPWIDPVTRLRAVDRWLERRERDRRRRLSRARGQGADVAAAVAVELDAEARDDARKVAAIEGRLRVLLRERYQRLSRQYVLLSAAVHADGRVGSAVGVESFLQQYVDRSGEAITLSPRIGVETEPVAHWIKVRAGSYLEPSRFRGGSARTHLTAGFDTALVRWSVFGLFDRETRWRLSGAVDGARDYFGWGASLGVWR